MKLNLALIENELGINPEFVCGQTEHEVCFFDMRPFPILNYDPAVTDHLYITTWDKLKNVSRPPAYLLCVGGGKNARRYLETHGVNGLIYPDDINMYDLFNKVQNLFNSMHRLEWGLYSQILTNAPVRQVLDTCTSFFNNPVMLVDSQCGMLECSSRLQIDLQQNRAAGMKRVLDFLLKSDIWHPTNNINKSFYFPASETTPSFMLLSFTEGDKHVATMVVAGLLKPIQPYQKYILDYLSDMVRPYITKQFSASYDIMNYIRMIILLTVRNAHIDPAVVASAISKIGWKIDDDYILITIDTMSELIDKNRDMSDMLKYESIFPDSVAVKTDTEILLLVHNDTRETIFANAHLLEEELIKANASCGVSLPFNDFYQLANQHTLCRVALGLGNQNQRIRYYGETMIKHVANILASSISLKSICHRAALRIYNYDKKNGTELLPALEAYLRNNKSIKAAANELFIHRNTLSYRLGIIKSIVSLQQIEDPKERAHLLFSCMLLLQQYPDALDQ